MKFYTLIHICKDEQSMHNNSFVKSFADQINRYFGCAKQLHQSLKATGIEVVILTNDKAFLQDLNKDQYSINIIQLNFNLDVPSGVKFYSAHFKLEVYQYLSTLNEEYIGLVDCDIVCVNDMPASFKNCIDYKVPLYYDITDQMTPLIGADKIISDKERLGKSKSLGLWAGGEFIAGPPGFFKLLYQQIVSIKEVYFNDFSSFKHQGDEMITSVAIEKMMLNSNVRIMDAGSLSIIGRFWSPKTLHVQKSLRAYSNHFLLHLPSDKKFINALKKEELKGEVFFNNYRYHLLKYRIIENAVRGIKPYIKKGSKKLAKMKSGE